MCISCSSESAMASCENPPDFTSVARQIIYSMYQIRTCHSPD